MKRSLTRAALLFATVGLPACGDISEAESLQRPVLPNGHAGRDSSLPEASLEQDAAPDVLEDSDGAMEAAKETLPPPLPDPFEPPPVELGTWQGRLPPGSLFDPKIHVTFPRVPLDGEPLPLIVFAHGFQLSERDYVATAAHLASFGYVVASVDYDGSLVDQNHHAPVTSMARAVDWLTSTPPPAITVPIDASRIVASGHSIGAKGAVWMAMEDARVKALLAFDPVDDNPSPVPIPSASRPSLAPERMSELHVPALYVAGHLSPNGDQPCAPASSNACRFVEATTPGLDVSLLVVERFGHMQFVDAYDCGLACATCDRGSLVDHPPGQRVARGLAVAFLELQMRGRLGYASWLQGDDRMALEAQQMVLDPAEQAAFCATQ